MAHIPQPRDDGLSPQLTEKINKLAIEVAANRLVLRALLANWMRTSAQNAGELESLFDQAIEAMAPQTLSADGISPVDLASAIELVRSRARGFLSDGVALSGKQA
jgi:hypothetical protein